MPITLDGTNGITQADQFNSDSTFGFKNRIINGAMVIDQRNAGASVTNIAGSVYSLDRWQLASDQASKFTVQQNAGSVTPPVGFSNYLGATSLSAYSVPSSENYIIRTKIEGYNIADLGWGTANAKTITLSFWVRSSLTGTFGGALANNASGRTYPFSYSIPVANTWTAISITVVGDTTGTWLTNNGIGLEIRFSLGSGTAQSGTAGSWSSSNYYSATGATSVVGTNGATWYVTGCQLEIGSTATSFDYRPYGTELALCKRYTHVIGNGNTGSGIFAVAGVNRSASATWFSIPLPVPMRTTPSFSITNSGTVRISCKGVAVDSSANSTTVGGASPDFTYDNSTDGDLSVSYQSVSGTSPSANSVDTGMQFSYGRFIFSAEL